MIRRTVHAWQAALALALSATAMSLLLAACEHYPSDLGELEPPSLTHFGVTPDSVDLTHGAGSATLTIGVRSPGGADSAAVVLTSPSGEETLACVAREPDTGSREAGNWECTVTLAPGLETGVWRTERVSVHRGGAEVLRLLGADLRSANFPATLRVGQALPPLVGITAPGPGERFTAGETIRLDGWARDARTEAPLPDSALVWSSNLDGEIGSGASLATVALSAGPHTLTLTAAGAAGLSGTDEVQIVVEERVEVAAVEVTPEAVGLTAIGDTVRFRARALDAAGNAVPDAAFEWRTLDAKVATIEANGLATARGYGTTLVWVRAGDVTATASLTVHAPPAVGITAPEEGATFTLGDAVRFEGWATRAGDVPLPDSALVWSSSIDGPIGTGRVVTTTALSVGSHTISLTATSEQGLSSTAQIRITIEAPRAAVVAHITILPEAASVEMGDTVHLRATAYDTAWAEIPGAVFAWSSEVPAMATVDSDGVVTGVRAGEGPVTITAAVGDVEASIQLWVSPPAGLPRAEIVAPADSSVVRAGDTIRLIGRGIGVDGEPITSDSDFWWRGTDHRVLGYGREISAVLSTVGEHTISLYARDGSGFVASTQIHLTVEEAPQDVDFILIEPYEAELDAIGDTVRFTARAFDGYEREITGAVFEWGSSDTTLVSIDADGLATANGYGSAWIHARVGTVSERAQVRVVTPSGPPVVATVQVFPLSAPPGGMLPIGEAIPFVARAYDSEWNELSDLVFTWSSSDTTVATVDGAGEVTGRAPGWVTIRAATGGVGDEYEIEVGGAPLVSITAPDDGASFEQGTPITFTGSAYSAAGEALAGAALVWTSDLDGGLGTGERVDTEALVVGTHTITLTATDAHGQSASHRITIEITPRPVVASITIDPAEAGRMWTGDTVHFSARAFDAGGTEIPEVIVHWTSTDPAVARINAGGLATVRGHGVTEIRAEIGDISAAATLSVGQPSVRIQSPQYGSGHTEGDTIDFIGSATGVDGAELPDGALVWESNDGVIGTGRHVRSAALSPGGHVIVLRATDRFGRSAEDHYNITIYPRRVVAHIGILPEAAGVEVGDTVHLTATAYDDDWNEIPDVAFEWSSSAPHLASIDGNGVVRGVAAAEVPIEITAAVGGVEASIRITVSEPWSLPTVASVRVTPGSAAPDGPLTVGERMELRAQALDGDGMEVFGVAFTWASSDAAVASVDGDGWVTGHGTGRATIRATVGSISGAYEVEVGAARELSRIEIAPAEAALTQHGDTVRFHARAFDQFGDEMSGVVFTWTSRDHGVAPVATIDGAGLATAFMAGVATIEASADDHRAEAVLVVGGPEIGITTPGPFDPNGEPPVWGSAITFEGWGTSRAEYELADDELVWTSSLDGRIGTGTRFTTTALSAGFHTITLTGTDRFGLSGTATLDTFVVAPSMIHAIGIDPPLAILERLGETIQLEPTTYLVSGDELGDPVPGHFTYRWMSEDSSVVTVDENGRATARGWGEVRIIAFTNTGAGSARIFVGMPDITSLQIRPSADLTLEEVGDTYQLEASGSLRRGTAIETLRNLPVHWTSDDPAVATIDARGLVTARGAGSTLLRATLGDLSAEVAVYVYGPAEPIVYIEYPAESDVFGLGDEVYFQGWARDGWTELPLPASALVWTSSRDGEIGRGESFTSTTLSEGEHIITLTATTEHGMSASFEVRITVESRTVARVEVTPDEVGIDDWDPVPLAARAFDVAGRELPDVVFTWTSRDPELLIVDSAGVVRRNPTTEMPGAVWVVASVGAASDSALVVIGRPNVRIDGPSYGSTFVEGGPITFSGSGQSQDGAALPDSLLVWTSDLDGEVGRGRLVTTAALSVGEHIVTLSATDRFGFESYPHHVRVVITEAPVVAWITILPEAASVEMGDTVHLRATAYDTAWAEIPGAVFAWSSEVPAMATVDSDGVVTGVRAGEGPVTITAAVGDVEASIQLWVSPPAGLPRAEIVAPADSSVVRAGDTIRLIGRGIGVDGEPITSDSDFWWRGTDHRVLGYGREISAVLSTVGEHTISLYARDGSGFVASTQIRLTVEDAHGIGLTRAEAEPPN